MVGPGDRAQIPIWMRGTLSAPQARRAAPRRRARGNEAVLPKLHGGKVGPAGNPIARSFVHIQPIQLRSGFAGVCSVLRFMRPLLLFLLINQVTDPRQVLDGPGTPGHTL